MYRSDPDRRNDKLSGTRPVLDWFLGGKGQTEC